MLVLQKCKETWGVSPVALIAILFLMASLSYAFVYLIEAKHMAFPMAYHASRAFYITEGGIQYTAKYLRGYSDWSSVPNIGTTGLGGGSFAVTFQGGATDSITASISGSYGDAERVLSVSFSGSTDSLLSENAVSSGSTVSGTDNIDPPDSYEEYVSDSDAPSVSPPEGQTYTSRTISGTTSIAPGTYYYSELILSNNVTVTIDPSGPVTIWIQGKLEMKNGSSLNWTGDAANLLILSAATGSPGIDVKNSGQFRGAIYAPDAKITLGTGGQFTGAVVGDEVVLNSGSTFSFDPDAGSLCDGYSATGSRGIAVADWEEDNA